MDATSLGLPKPELTDGGTTTTERQAYKDAWDAQVETADANILTAIGTGGALVDTAANFTATNPTLNENQFGYESDMGKFKLGDGVTAWNSLVYYFDGSGAPPPTGTGWRHVTAGVEDGAASTPSKTDVGLSNVTNDAQLKRATGDFATFTEKVTPVDTDLLLIEDSESDPVGAKKKIQMGNLAGLPSVADWPEITDKPEISVGDTGYASLDAILAGSPAAGTSILVPAGTHTLHASTNRTVPVGVNLKALAGAAITIPSGRTFTINGTFEAGPYQVFVDNSTQNTLISITNTGSARDAGGGTTGIPMPTGHGVVGGNYVNMLGTTNYNGIQLVASVSANEIVINSSFIEETFGASATVQNVSIGVKFASGSATSVYAEWWGFKTSAFDDGTQATANTEALKHALNATLRGGDQFIVPVTMAAGTPYTQGGITAANGSVILRGAGAGNITYPGSAIFCVHNPANTTVIDFGFIELADFYLSMYEDQTKGIYVNTRGCQIQRLYMEGVYNDNDDTSSLIYLDEHSNQARVKDIHIIGRGNGIYDRSDGGLIANIDMEGTGYVCSGIIAGGSFIHDCQIQYYKYGIQTTAVPEIMMSGLNLQQNIVGLYAPYLTNFNVSNSRFGANHYGIQWLGGYAYGYNPATLTNCRFRGNTKAAIVFQGACHGTLSDIDMDVYINNADFHNMCVGFYPAYIDTALASTAIKFPVFKNIKLLVDTVIQEPVINIYDLTGLNGTFAAPYETGLTVTATAGSGQDTLVRSSGSWAAAGLRVGDYVTLSGFANPVLNAEFEILSIGTPNAQTMVVDNWQPVNETSGAAAISYFANPSLYVPAGIDFTDYVTEGDNIKMTGNFTEGSSTNNGWPLTVWQVTADTLRFSYPMTDSARSSLAYRCPETATSINISRLPHVFGEQFTLRAASATSLSKLYGMGEGAKATVTLDDPNVTIDKWGTPDMAATKAGAVYTDVTDSASFTLFPSSPSVNDAVYIGGDFLPSAIKISMDAAYGGTPPTFDWEYYNGVGGGWDVIPSHTVPNFASTGEFITWFSMPVDAIPVRFFDIAAADGGGTNSRKYLYWVRCRITDAGSPTGSVTCDAAIEACWLRMSTDTFPTSPIGIGEMATLTLENSNGVIKEISRSEP